MNWGKNKLQTKKDKLFLVSFSRYNSFLVVCWALCVVMLLTYFVSKQFSYRLMGVTQAHQYRVQFENPVVVEEIVIPSGQEVKKGDLMLKLSSSKLSHELASINMELYKKFSEYRLYNSSIKSLKKFKTKIEKKKDKTLLEMEMLSLIEIKDLINGQVNKLNVLAPFDGYVGNFNFVLGETVPAFSPVSFVTEKNATTIRSYVLENDPSATRVRVGQIVDVYRSSGARGGEGKVFQIGAEVRELPARFQKTGYDTAYGREILVKINEMTKFITGERVSVEFSN